MNIGESTVRILQESNNEWSNKVDPIEIIDYCCSREFDMDVDGDVIVVNYGETIEVMAFNGYDAYETVDTYSFWSNGMTPSENYWEYLPDKVRISSHSGSSGNTIEDTSFHKIYVLTGFNTGDGEIAVLSIDWDDD